MDVTEYQEPNLRVDVSTLVSNTKVQGVAVVATLMALAAKNPPATLYFIVFIVPQVAFTLLFAAYIVYSPNMTEYMVALDHSKLAKDFLQLPLPVVSAVWASTMFVLNTVVPMIIRLFRRK
jgi:hypothetical protein